MGGNGSKEPKAKHCCHSALPVDTVPYEGPRYTYLLCQVQVQLSTNMTFGFSGGRPMVTSNIDNYYPMLTQYSQQGYMLHTFYRVPFVGQAGFGSMVMPYEAMFSKPTDGSLPYEGVQYDLRIEKSLMHLQAMSFGIIGTPQVAANTSDIIQKIAQHSSQGGRLICIEMTGYMQSQGFQNALQGTSGGMGVDLLFNIPRTPNAPLYSYQAVHVPIGFRVQPGFASSTVNVECDFMGHFAAYLNQGWKLVEIFLDQGMQRHGAFSMSAQLNSVWFFEKENLKINDPQPQYEGIIITYEHMIKSGFGGVKVKSDWSPLLQQMGEKGWELACLLETPQQRRTGFTTASVTILLFFQRRIIHSS